MAKKTIAAVEVSGKRVLIRVDFNVPFESGVIDDDRRIRAAIPTIKSVIDRGGKAILCSHLGRPEGKGYEADSSLAPCAKRLGELLGKPVIAPRECTFAEEAFAEGRAVPIEHLDPGGIADAIAAAIGGLPQLGERAALHARKRKLDGLQPLLSRLLKAAPSLYGLRL